MTLDQRVDALVSRMTLEEKISQLIFDAPAIERLGIPAFNWWSEALHGAARAGLATVFPQAIGLGATWNPDLLQRVAVATAEEARAKHHEAVRRGIRARYAGLTIWSPNVNIFRDPRWGRGQETYGEDPYLSARMGVAYVRGLQGDHPQYLKLAATPKHFAVHSGPELERHHFDAQVSERDLRETYLPAFEACVREGRAASIMGAYNRVNGEPACASPTLLERILREEWGFEGYVVSDCGAIRDIYKQHQAVEDAASASALAVRNGCDLNCGYTYQSLREAISAGMVSESEVDRSVTRLFRARFLLGMFDPPEQVPFAQIPYEVVDAPLHRSLALEAARQSIVLLKNEAGLLPLKKDLACLAVIGPNADRLASLLGNYHGTPQHAITPLEGIRSKVSASTQVLFAQGCEIAGGVRPMQAIPSGCLIPKGANPGENGLRGSYYANPYFHGEPAAVRLDAGIDFTWKDASPLSGGWGDPFSIRWTGSLSPKVSGNYRLGVEGLNSFRLFLNGDQVLACNERDIPHLETVDFELRAGQSYSIQLDYVNRGLDPQVKLLWSPPGYDYLEEALEAARQAEVVILLLGLSPELEGEEMPVFLEGFSGGDRTDIRLPETQEQLLRRLQALGKPVVLVLLNGSALAIHWAAEHVPAIVEAWYPGQSGGEALAEVLFGERNPAGRLPVTFYASIEDLPPFEDYQMEGRTYRYFRKRPLYAFGHGLSYTRFVYQNLQVSQQEMQAGEKVEIGFELTNSGDMPGDEVVQLYIRQASVPEPAPEKELKGFARLSLQPGETKNVAFTLFANQLRSFDAGQGWRLLPGRVEIWVGGSSQDLPLHTQIQVRGKPVKIEGDQSFFSKVAF